jgi:hypothetical protein
MPNRPSRAASSGRKGASIEIGGFGLGDIASPELNKYFGKDQEEANIEAGRNVDTQQLYSKPTFWQKLFNPQAATEAARMNAEFAVNQLLSKQDFANRKALTEIEMANRLQAQAKADEAAMDRMVAERGFIGAEGDKTRQAQIEGQLRAQRQAEFLASEAANRERGFKLEDDVRQNAPVGQAIWHSNYRGELPYDINPQTEQDFVKIARMAPIIFGKQGVEAGMLEQPVAESARAAIIAKNRLAASVDSDEKAKDYELGKRAKDAFLTLDPGRGYVNPGATGPMYMGALTKQTPIFNKFGEQSIFSGKFSEEQTPPSATESPDVIYERNRANKARLAAAMATAPSSEPPAKIEPVNPFRAELESRITGEEQARIQEQLGEYRALIRRLHERIKAGGRPVSDWNPTMLTDTPEEQKKFLKEAADLEDKRQQLLEKSLRRPVSKQ